MALHNPTYEFIISYICSVRYELMKMNLFKVHIFWEGHKILQYLHLTFDCVYCSRKYGGDFAKFCGLLRIYELYRISFWVLFSNWKNNRIMEVAVGLKIRDLNWKTQNVLHASLTLHWNLSWLDRELKLIFLNEC